MEYFINVIKIKNDKEKKEEDKTLLFEKEKDDLLFNLDSLLEKNFMKVKYAPYLIELVELYNEDNQKKEEEHIDKFWIHSFVRGNQDILDKISAFYNVGNINLKNMKEQLEIIKQKRNKTP